MYVGTDGYNAFGIGSRPGQSIITYPKEYEEEYLKFFNRYSMFNYYPGEDRVWAGYNTKYTFRAV